MVNSTVFSGEDALIALSVETGVEGDKARQVIDTCQLNIVGRATSLELRVNEDLKPYHEVGQQYPTVIKSGNVTVSGTISRGYINGGMLKLLLGDAATSRPAGVWVQPTFNISIRMGSPSAPGLQSTIVLHGVKFQNWSLIIPEGEFIMEKVDFLAAWIRVEDDAK